MQATARSTDTLRPSDSRLQWMARVRGRSFIKVPARFGILTLRRQAATGNQMIRITGIICRLYSDETGGEVLEYALIAGLIVVGSLAMILKVGTKVLARWASLNSSL